MFTDAQLLYLTEVLGTDAAHYRVAPRPGAAPIVVWTPTLGPEERQLLAKILGSVGLNDFTHIEDGVVEAFRHCLRFDGAALGRRAVANGVEWSFPELRTMVGASVEVTARKREVWTLLQDFRREV